MPNYRWKCLVCETVNNQESDYCCDCGCPSDASGSIVSGWNTPTEKPTLNLINLGLWGELAVIGHETSPCPKCSYHIYITSSQCSHCDAQFSISERYGLVKTHRQVKKKGQHLGLVVFPMVLVIIVGLTYAASNF